MILINIFRQNNIVGKINISKDLGLNNQKIHIIIPKKVQLLMILLPLSQEVFQYL